MLRAAGPLIACVIMVTMVACSKSDSVDSQANAAGIPAINDPVADPAGGPPAPGASAQPTAAGGPIPTSLQGRWGLSPMDCTSTRGDAKGLLIVSADNVRFYESRAVPAPDTRAGTDSISGEFRFTGEGQTWSKFETLELKGEELVRTESNPMASFTYARCN